MKPYYQDDSVTLYCADCRDVLPGLDVDLVVADPPYSETSLSWDVWPDRWLEAAAEAVNDSGTMWCFGTLRMFMQRAVEFDRASWQLAQDIAGKPIEVLWEKHNGSGFHNDRFRRVHEQIAQFYPSRSSWGAVYKQVQYTNDATARTVRRKACAAHWHGERKRSSYVSHDGGPRLMRSVIECRSMHGYAMNETEKPVDLIAPIVEYSCPPGGLIADPFCGAGPVLEVAKRTGRRAIACDVREDQCEIAARRLMNCNPLPFPEPAPAPEQGRLDL